MDYVIQSYLNVIAICIVSGSDTHRATGAVSNKTHMEQDFKTPYNDVIYRTSC